MKKTKFWALGLAFIMIFSTHIQQSHAEETYNMFSKFGRGVSNIVLSPGEYFIAHYRHADRHDAITSFFATLGMGTVKMLGRALGGAYEIVTFPLPLPAEYRPILDPPDMFDAFDRIS